MECYFHLRNKTVSFTCFLYQLSNSLQVSIKFNWIFFFFNFQDLMMMMLSLLLSSHLMKMARSTVKGKHYVFLPLTYCFPAKFLPGG